MADPLPVFDEVCLVPQVVCDCPTFLRWSNITAGERFWVFDGNTTTTTPTQDLAEFVPYSPFLATREEGRALLGKRGEERVTVRARNVDKQWYEWLQSLAVAPYVWLLVDNTPGAYQWRNVILESVQMSKECKDRLFDVVVIFSIPEINTVKRT